MPGYIAPEILLGQKVRRGDLLDMFAFGVLIYFALTGRLPFPGSSSSSVCRKIAKCQVDFDRQEGARLIDADCKAFLSGLINRDPKRRLSASQALANPWI